MTVSLVKVTHTFPNWGAAAESVLDSSPYALANLADVHGPDTPQSPGAEFLASVWRDLVDCLSEVDGSTPAGGLLDALQYDGRLDKLANSAVPDYTYTRWLVFVDLCAWNVDMGDRGALEGDMTELAGVALYVAAEVLLGALVTELVTELEDADLQVAGGDDE